ncbi:hypothetical protein SANA_19350 [Gottschalkiaceae bacterium SANA]|nr:hypothetical protein SANA_19350 [Gottschalkiaceae bacterium SANA]
MRKLFSILLCLILLTGIVTTGFAIEDPTALTVPAEKDGGLDDGTDDITTDGKCVIKKLTVSIKGCGELYLDSINGDSQEAGEVHNGDIIEAPNHAQIILTATPGDCCEFIEAEVNGNKLTVGSSMDPVTLTVDLDGNKKLAVCFSEILHYNLAYGVDGGGWIESNVSAGSVTCGSLVDLTAYADPCWGFDYWSGLPEGVATDASSVDFYMDDDYTDIVAYFVELDLPMLTVEVVGNGEGYTNPPSPIEMPCDDSMSIEAIASPCSIFIQWEEEDGTPISSEAIHDFAITVDTTVYAHFELSDETYPVSWSTAGEGTGTIDSGEFEQISYPCGTLIELTAEPDMCSEYSHWSKVEGGTVSGSTITFPLMATTAVTAYFDLKDDVTLTVETAGEGNYEVSTTSVTVACGEPVSVTATPGDCTLFNGWTGVPDEVLDPTAETITFDLYNDMTITASFDWDPQMSTTLTVLTAGDGYGTVSPASATAPCGETIWVSATPSSCSLFEGWSYEPGGEPFNSNRMIPYMMDEMDQTIYANFSLNPQADPVTLTVRAVGEGDGDATIIGWGTSATVTCGTVVTVTATPGACSEFYGWVATNGASWFMETADLSVTFEMQGDLDLEAVFMPLYYELTIATNGNGITDPEGPLTVTCGTTIMVEAIADSGYSFIDWTGDVDEGQETQTLIEVQMDQDRSITANFTEPSPPPIQTGGGGLIVRHTLTISVEGNGTVDPFVGSQNYNPGTLVDLTVTPALGWTFAGWFGADGAEVVNEQIEMDDDKILIARFETTILPEAPPLEAPEIEIPLIETPLGDGDLPYTGQAFPIESLGIGLIFMMVGTLTRKNDDQ